MNFDEPLRLASADQTDEFYKTLRSRHERFAIHAKLFFKDFSLRVKDALTFARAELLDSMLGEFRVITASSILQRTSP